MADNSFYFDTNALNLSEEQKKDIDLISLQKITEQVEGGYDTIVILNKKMKGNYNLSFKNRNGKLTPLLSQQIASSWGIELPSLTSSKDEEFYIEDVIPGAKSDFDLNKRSLNISIPLAYMDFREQNEIKPSEWNNGLAMAFVDYNISSVKSTNTKKNDNTNLSFLSLRNGVNFAGWRARNYSYYNKQSNQQSKWNSLQTWVERDISVLKSLFSAGQISTSNLTLESFIFRGLNLASQDSMLSDNQQGYSPEIRGVALSNAVVEVRQNGNLLYQTSVPPGEFVINNMYPTSSSGDLNISVIEEDGAIHNYTQAYATPPISVRKGALKYGVSIGEYDTHFYNNTHNALSQKFSQTEFIYGLLDTTSIYGGFNIADHYQSLQLGMGQSLGRVGAISIDSTVAKAKFNNGDKHDGQSVQIKYSKYFDYSRTSLTLAGYRYNSGGYYSFDEASNNYYQKDVYDNQAMKQKMQLTISQPMGNFGSLSVSAYQADYKNGSASRKRSMMGSWTKSFDYFSTTVSQSQSKTLHTGKTDNITSLSIRIPFSRLLPGNTFSSTSFNSTISRSGSGRDSFTSTLSGTNLENNNLSWSVSQSKNKFDYSASVNSSAISGAYKGNIGSVNLGYVTSSTGSDNINWGAQGSIIAHPYGITMSRTLPEGSSYALVKTDNAHGIYIENSSGIRTNYFGQAVVPSLMPYRKNEINLDTSSLPEETDIEDPIKTIIPSKEALVLANYKTYIGHRLFITILNNGKKLPIGTIVSVGERAGMVNESSQLYISGVQNNSKLTATLDNNRKCNSIINLDSLKNRNGIYIGEIECR